ncbi:hypothetical protein [Candidatus Protochlamydia sp. W-9]|uniref:hypothetical protein n=1 Tax=Candidatus Protochlamydia sp. W-9 TaxID=1785087 RepID=UPI00096A26A6|nr:hypothetical protein [Candidatus Protochlamydia sp. W-9]
METQSVGTFSTGEIEEIRILFESLKKTETRNRELIDKVETVCGQILLVTDPVRSLQKDNVDLTQKITVHNQDNGKFKETMLNHEQQISLLQKEFQKVQETLNEKVRQIADIQRTLEKYEKERQELSERNTRLVNENVELVNERVGLNTLLEDLRKEKSELENQEKAHQEEINRLKQDLNEAQSRYSELKRSSNLEISEKIRLIANKKLKCEKLTQVGILIRKDRDQAKQKLAERQAVHTQTRRNLLKERAGHIQTSQSLAQVKAEHAQTTRKLNQTQHKLTQSQQTVSRQKIDYQELENKLGEIDSRLISQEELQKMSKKIQSREEIKELITRLSLINLNDLNELQDWVKDCTTTFGFNDDERRNLESNLSNLLSKPGFFTWPNMLREGVMFSLEGASIHYLPLLISLLSKLIK